MTALQVAFYALIMIVSAANPPPKNVPPPSVPPPSVSPPSLPTPSISWSYCTDFAAAQKAEKQKDLPLCIFYFTSEDRNKPANGNKIVPLEVNVAFQNLPKIDLLSPSQDPAFLNLVKRLGGSTLPVVLLCDCRSHILGVFFSSGTGVEPGLVKEIDSRAATDQVATARIIVKWERSVDDQLHTLEYKLKNHQYSAVATLIAQIDAQDRNFTNQLGANVPWQPADQQEPWFFKKEVRDAKDKLKEAIKKEVVADKELLAAGKRYQVHNSLDNIRFFKDDPELAKQIVELTKQFDHDSKAVGPTASAVSAVPAAAK